MWWDGEEGKNMRSAKILEAKRVGDLLVINNEELFQVTLYGFQ